jgi:hypothetical protein
MLATNFDTRTSGGPRVIPDVLAPLNLLARTSTNLIAAEPGKFETGQETGELPRYLFIGPRGGGDTIRLGLFAGIHGDEPEGVHALVRFLHLLEAQPELATGYCLFIYPICNPTGFADRTRHSRRGKDLNREFWRNSAEPEVRLLQSELVAHAFAGIISLHTDDTSRGFYGFAHGATLTRHLIEPELEAAAEFLPRNPNPAIDGFPARNGIIRQACPGVLSAPPKMRPRPFQITLETPFAPNFFKEAALVAALRTILIRYRELMAYAPNLQFQVCCPPKPSCQFVSIRVSLSSVFRPLSSVLCPPSSAPAPPPAKCSPRGRGHSAFRIRADSTLRPVPKVLCCPP